VSACEKYYNCAAIQADRSTHPSCSNRNKWNNIPSSNTMKTLVFQLQYRDHLGMLLTYVNAGKLPEPGSSRLSLVALTPPNR
jgi:hypothetical protein